ncbi:putative quinone oxidoreductase [Myriangium duriaei CBS 260.36]|uniref:Quinone oxidoreductase n=1 Tax=Myriangium duriaei CBS 260.36 TaxID=1168546 RepID=A0A9P4J7H1_9PEZI|nr:putative quinone oxidoreductase [Myriangium duriaei CBS 260.36]
MNSAIVNQAAWVVAEKAHPMEVRRGPTPAPNANEVVIKVIYAAVNPTDYKMQFEPYFQMEYPFVFGTDVSGIVFQIGSNVTKFKIGQRVIGHCDSLMTRKSTNAGFQLYSTCREGLVSAVPDNVPLSNAAVLPLAVDTAAGALFLKLGLPLPSLNPKQTTSTILIWGGASSVGSCAIQLAVAAGLRVITTASKSNFDYVRALGASQTFDYHDEDSVKQIKNTLKIGDKVVDCIGLASTQGKCADILHAIGGGDLPVVLWPQGDFPEDVQPRLVNGLATGFTSDELGSWGPGAAEIGQALWHDYIPKALAEGHFQAKPDPFVIEGGLAKVQEAVDMLRNGVSAKKIVIEVQAES